jgi:hypothetical protein
MATCGVHAAGPMMIWATEPTLQSSVREGARQHWIALGDPASTAGLDLSNAPSARVPAHLRKLHG